MNPVGEIGRYFTSPKTREDMARQIKTFGDLRLTSLLLGAAALGSGGLLARNLMKQKSKYDKEKSKLVRKEERLEKKAVVGEAIGAGLRGLFGASEAVTDQFKVPIPTAALYGGGGLLGIYLLNKAINNRVNTQYDIDALKGQQEFSRKLRDEEEQISELLKGRGTSKQAAFFDQLEKDFTKESETTLTDLLPLLGIGAGTAAAYFGYRKFKDTSKGSIRRKAVEEALRRHMAANSNNLKAMTVRPGEDSSIVDRLDSGDMNVIPIYTSTEKESSVDVKKK